MNINKDRLISKYKEEEQVQHKIDSQLHRSMHLIGRKLMTYYKFLKFPDQKVKNLMLDKPK